MQIVSQVSPEQSNLATSPFVAKFHQSSENVGFYLIPVNMDGSWFSSSFKLDNNLKMSELGSQLIEYLPLPLEQKEYAISRVNDTIYILPNDGVERTADDAGWEAGKPLTNLPSGVLFIGNAQQVGVPFEGGSIMGQQYIENGKAIGYALTRCLFNVTPFQLNTLNSGEFAIGHLALGHSGASFGNNPETYSVKIDHVGLDMDNRARVHFSLYDSIGAPRGAYSVNVFK